MYDNEDTQPMKIPAELIRTAQVAKSLVLRHEDVVTYHWAGNGSFTLFKSGGEVSLPLCFKDEMIHVWYRGQWVPTVMENEFSLFEGFPAQ